MAADISLADVKKKKKKKKKRELTEQFTETLLSHHLCKPKDVAFSS